MNCRETKADLMNELTKLKVRNKALENEIGECIWKEEKDIDSCHVYNTDCENMFEFVDGNPKDNNFKYCPYCGKAIKEETK